MKIAKIASIAMYFGLIAGAPALAQQWTPAQTEVWKNVEAYWARDAARDTEGFLAFFHENYIGWDLNEPLASNKSRLRKFVAYNHTTEETVVYDIQPVAINVFDDVAVVHYHYTVVTKDADRKAGDRSGRWADILMKQDNKWVLIGDHGGITSDE